MSTLLAERPLLLALMLAVLAAGLIYGWLQTGKRAVLLAGILLLAMIPVSWFVAESWVTDRERLEQILYDVADAVEANEFEKAVAVIGDRRLREQAELELSNYEFSQAEVTNIRRIVVFEDANPLQAEVELTAKVKLSQASGSIRDVTIPRRVLLQFEKRQPEGWVVIDYQHGPIAGGTDAYSTRIP